MKELTKLLIEEHQRLSKLVEVIYLSIQVGPTCGNICFRIIAMWKQNGEVHCAEGKLWTVQEFESAKFDANFMVREVTDAAMAKIKSLQ